MLGSGMNVNVLVLDTEVYSNTGGQMSKATPRGAVAKFATGGKETRKKDLAMEAISYGSVYVARVAMGGGDTHTVKAFREAEAYPGPSLIIAYSHCIAHGYDMAFGLNQQKTAVLSGYWPLMRYNPALREQGKNPFQLDSKAPSIPLKQYVYEEARYSMLARSHPSHARELLRLAQDDVDRQWRVYESRAAMAGEGQSAPEPVQEPAETLALSRREATTNDRPQHHLHGPAAEKSDRRLSFAAVRYGGQDPASRRSRHRRRRFTLVVRGATDPRQRIRGCGPVAGRGSFPESSTFLPE